MIETSSPVNDPALDAIEALRSVASFSYKRADLPFPARHSRLEFEDTNWAQTRTAAQVLYSLGYQAISARQASEVVSLIFARCGDEGFHTIGIPAPFTAEADSLLRCSRSLFLAVFGPDGVGKSSIASAAVAALGPLFDHQRTACWRPQFISSRIAKEPHKFKLPHGVSSYGPILSMMKLTGAFLDFLLDHVSSTRNLLRGCTLIAWDRYFHDVIVDPMRYRYRGPSWYSDLLLRSLPVPEHFLGIVLDADENVILARKRELPLDELRRQRVAYQRLAASCPQIHLLENDGEFGSCVRRVLLCITNAMATWFAPVAGELLSISQPEFPPVSGSRTEVEMPV
jgi:thymidylate kinase